MTVLPLLLLASARPAGLLFSVCTGTGVEGRTLGAGGLGRPFRAALPSGFEGEIAGADAPRRLLYVRLRDARYRTKAFAAFRYDRAGRLAPRAVTGMEPAAAAIAFDPTGRYAAVPSERNARTYRVDPDGTLGPLDAKALYGGTGDTVVAAASGDGRRLFVLNEGGYVDMAWAHVRAYSWRRDGTLALLPLNDRPDAQDHYTGIAPDRRGRFVYEFGRNVDNRNVRRLTVGITARKPPILGADYQAGAHDDVRQGLYLALDGRIDWVPDADPTHPRMIGHLATPTTVASTLVYNPKRRLLLVNAVDGFGSSVGLYQIGPDFRLRRLLEADLGPGHGAALWVPG